MKITLMALERVDQPRGDLRALRAHGIWSCLPLIYLKYLFKIWGFVFRK